MLLAATLIWGSSFIILKNTIDELPVCFVLGVRFTMAALIMAVLAPRGLRRIGHDTIKKGTQLGFIVFCAYLTQTVGLSYTTPSKNAFLTAAYVVIVPFLLWLFYRQRIARRHLLAAFITLCGIVSICFFTVGGIQKAQLLGDLLTVVCGFFYAWQIIFLERCGKREDTTQVLMLQQLTIGIACLVLSCIFELPKQTVSMQGSHWISIVYMAFACTFLAQWLQAQGQRFVPSEQASLFLMQESVFGTIFSALFYHERITWNLYLGFALIFVAVLISEEDLCALWKRRKQTE